MVGSVAGGGAGIARMVPLTFTLQTVIPVYCNSLAVPWARFPVDSGRMGYDAGFRGRDGTCDAKDRTQPGWCGHGRFLCLCLVGSHAAERWLSALSLSAELYGSDGGFCWNCHCDLRAAIAELARRGAWRPQDRAEQTEAKEVI